MSPHSSLTVFMGNLGASFPITGFPSRGFARYCARAAPQSEGSGVRRGPGALHFARAGAPSPGARREPPREPRVPDGAPDPRGSPEPPREPQVPEGAAAAHGAGEAGPPSPLPPLRRLPPPFCAVVAAGGAVVRRQRRRSSPAPVEAEGARP